MHRSTEVLHFLPFWPPSFFFIDTYQMSEDLADSETVTENQIRAKIGKLQRGEAKIKVRQNVCTLISFISIIFYKV